MTVIDSFRLTGKTAVVTGAGRGIGAAMALALAEAGADIIGISRTLETSGGAVGTAIRETGRRFDGLAIDLGSRDGVGRALETISAMDRPVDILINNAGLARRNPAESHSDADWAEVLGVDLTAPFMLARDLGRGMLERKSGKIIFLASMMSFQGGRDVVSYSAAKSGIAGVVHALANEWGDRGINVNAIAPGYIETNLTVASHGDVSRRAAFTSRIPAGRWGVPVDIAGAALFLASPASDYVHGVVLPVDGGWLVR